MNDAPRPSVVRRQASIMMATITGVTVVLLLLWVSDSVTAPPADGSTGYLPFTFFFPIGLMFGTIVGLPLCFVIGMPLWHVALRFGWQRRRQAAGCGGAAGALIAVLLPLWFGGSSTAARWDEALLFIGSFVIAGMCAGLVARHVAFPD